MRSPLYEEVPVKNRLRLSAGGFLSAFLAVKPGSTPNPAPGEYSDDSSRIAHAVMSIHGQKVFLNDRFGNKDKSLDCAVHLIVMFPSVEELLACYEFFKEGITIVDPFEKLPYSELSVSFVDQFGVQWSFMTEQ